MLNEQIIKTYSEWVSPVWLSNDNDLNFNGSQIQIEFFSAWQQISDYYKLKKPKRLKFLEIGAYKGLWAIAFYEFCKLNDIECEYLTITMMDQDPNNHPLINVLYNINKNGGKANLINSDSTSDTVLSKISEYSDTFDIVFIDAGHDYDSVMSDIQNFSSLSTDILLFHDIRPKQTIPGFGVYQAITDSNIVLDTEIVTNEFHMGIGIKYISN